MRRCAVDGLSSRSRAFRRLRVWATAQTRGPRYRIVVPLAVSGNTSQCLASGRKYCWSDPLQDRRGLVLSSPRGGGFGEPARYRFLAVRDGVVVEVVAGEDLGGQEWVCPTPQGLHAR